MHLAQNTPTFYMAVNLIVNFETTFCVLKFATDFAAEINDLIPLFGAI